MQTVTVLIADSNSLVRIGLLSVLKEICFLESVIELENADNLIEKISTNDVDLIIVSFDLWQYHEMNNWFKHNSQTYQIVIITQPGIEIENQSFIPTHFSREKVIEVLESKLQHIFSAPVYNLNQDELSLREKEIIREIALGGTSQEIADKLFLSPHTVITHRKNITRKLGIKTISGLTLYAFLNNIINIEDTQ